jgi:hypothetical protein
VPEVMVGAMAASHDGRHAFLRAQTVCYYPSVAKKFREGINARLVWAILAFPVCPQSGSAVSNVRRSGMLASRTRSTASRGGFAFCESATTGSKPRDSDDPRATRHLGDFIRRRRTDPILSQTQPAIRIGVSQREACSSDSGKDGSVGQESGGNQKHSGGSMMAALGFLPGPLPSPISRRLTFNHEDGIKVIPCRL